MSTKIPQAKVSGLFDGVERLRKFHEEYTGKRNVWRIPLEDDYVLDLNKNAYPVTLEKPPGGDNYVLPSYALVVWDKKGVAIMDGTAEHFESIGYDDELAVQIADYVREQVWERVHEFERAAVVNCPEADRSKDRGGSHLA